MSYKIQLDKFEGPLDLLLYLIKKNDIDVCDIPIAMVTDQYMEYIEAMKMLDLDIVGDFLVMAATLMQIKSRMLLPPDPLAQEPQEDPRSELVRRLEEYQQFKAIADELKSKEIQRQDLFSRVINEEQLNAIKEDAQEVFIEATLFDLINALNAAINSIPEKKAYEIKKEEYTVEGKIHYLLHTLLEKPNLSLMEIFRTCDGKVEMICTFIAVLELIRLKEIIMVQRRAFEDIEIIRNSDHEAAPTTPPPADGHNQSV